MEQLLLDFVPPAPSLQNFVAGENSQLMVTLVQLAARRLPEEVVYLWGPVGAGKSHLLQATVRHWGYAGQYLNARQSDMPDWTTLPDAIAVDNVAALNDAGQIALFNVINEARRNHGSVLVSGDCPPRRLTMRPELTSRLGSGLVYQLQPLSDNDKITALQQHAARRGLKLDQALGQYLLTHWRRDLPSLMQALDALDAATLREHRVATLPLLKQVLEKMPDSDF